MNYPTIMRERDEVSLPSRPVQHEIYLSGWRDEQRRRFWAEIRKAALWALIVIALIVAALVYRVGSTSTGM